ncbi:cysteine-rich receptor-like protein kinase 44 isoform X2 [Magnolia sinica]|uniref:cysteine-rich receptor-like protein kinase 44 isoform X2 n=1 Tax=Magnolia sinica TaxID=86752 RepID=UPI00265907DF|nr:cysteine-rich receptor-like protein kinase 44 isoform X2 [Magnolia sinica]
MQITNSRLFSFTISLLLFTNPTSSDPQTNLVTAACVSNNAIDPFIFSSNLNSVFAELRSLLNSSHFAMAQRIHTIEMVYAIAQCRHYLSTSDCLSCFSTATSELQTRCLNNIGAHAVYDGCFLRYENVGFFDQYTQQYTQPWRIGLCGNRTEDGGGFTETAREVLSDLCMVTPRIDGFSAAVRRETVGGRDVYGVAQCLVTVGQNGCDQCLKGAYGNIEKCPPSADGRAVDGGCFLRYSDTAFFNDDQMTNLAPFLKRGASSNKRAEIGGGIGAAAFILLLVLLFAVLRCCKRTEKTRNRRILGATELRAAVNFHYRDLKSATENFSERNKLGQGGFGDVYKGVMKNGETVAVKKLMIRESGREEADFESEVRLISNLHHRNLVRLLGCCSNGPELLLVYEYMANSSLDKFLFGGRRGTLNLKQRFDIIIGMARGLAYMHEEFHVCIIHRDIKSSNILLDDDFQPRIADFGLARLLPNNWSHLSTRVAGTLGYTAPEYAIHGQLSKKADTYSFGVVVLEIISGQRSNDIKIEPVTQYLLEWAWRLYEEESLMELVDKSLDLNECRTDEVKKVIEIGLMCTQAPATRPTMSQVVVLLLNQGRPDVNLIRPAFIGGPARNHHRALKNTSASTGSSTSNATMSITQISAR